MQPTNPGAQPNSQQINLNTLVSSQNATFSVTPNLNINVFVGFQDRIKLALERNIDRVQPVTSNTFSDTSLIASAAFNVMSTVTPIAGADSKFTDTFGVSGTTWTNIFEFLAIASVFWLVFIVIKVLYDAYQRREKRKNAITIDQLVDILKSQAY